MFHPFTIFGDSIEAGVLQQNVLEELSFSVQSINQVHENAILEVEGYCENDKGHDAMVCKKPNIRLMVKTADCNPLVLADEEAGIIAAVHAGWRSLVQDIIPKTVQSMLEKGAACERILAAMGPSLGLCCSEFSNPSNEIPQKYHWAIRSNNHVDLLGIAYAQLAEAGILEENIEGQAICTCCSEGWPSWRKNQDKARFGTVIMLKS